jgi:hypothetical protein
MDLSPDRVVGGLAQGAKFRRFPVRALDRIGFQVRFSTMEGIRSAMAFRSLAKNQFGVDASLSLRFFNRRCSISSASFARFRSDGGCDNWL